MNPAHLHLLVNHFPIIGTYLALPLLVIAAWRRADRGALLAVVLVLAISGATAVAANLTGDPAESRVESLPSVSKHWIDEHSERADYATVVAVVTAVGAIGLLAWAMRRGETPLAGLAVLGFLTTISAGAMAWTGLAGGQIHHGELRAPGDNTSNAAERGGERAGGERGRPGGARPARGGRPRRPRGPGEAGEAGEAAEPGEAGEGAGGEGEK